MSSWPRWLDPHALGAERRHLGADAVEHLLGRPPGLGLDHVGLVLVGEQVGRTVDQVADQLAVAEGQLLAGVRDERVAALAALVGVPQHAVGVVGGDEHERRRAHPGGDRLQLDEPRLAHRAGVERRELRHGGVGGAHEPGGVPGLGDAHRGAVDAVPLQPGAVVGEVLAGRADQHRREAEPAEAEAHVGCHAARGGSRARRRGRRPRACRAARPRASRGTSPRTSSGGRWRWSRRSAGTRCNTLPSALGLPDGSQYRRDMTSPSDDTRRVYDELAPARRHVRRRAPRPAATCASSARPGRPSSRRRASTSTTTRARSPSARSGSPTPPQRLANALHLHLD